MAFGGAGSHAAKLETSWLFEHVATQVTVTLTLTLTDSNMACQVVELSSSDTAPTKMGVDVEVP